VRLCPRAPVPLRPTMREVAGSVHRVRQRNEIRASKLSPYGRLAIRPFWTGRHLEHRVGPIGRDAPTLAHMPPNILRRVRKLD